MRILERVGEGRKGRMFWNNDGMVIFRRMCCGKEGEGVGIGREDVKRGV